jgi:hypothetical protein
MEIRGSKHEPPGAHIVPELLESMCDYVNNESGFPRAYQKRAVAASRQFFPTPA